MTCKYAYDAGYNKALEKVREFINAQHETIMTEKRKYNSDRTEWWRKTGEQDFILRFLDKISSLYGENNEL